MKEILDRAALLRKSGEYDRALELLLALRDEQDGEVCLSIAQTYDARGEERKAAPYYERAIDAGLTGDSLRAAHICLGSTYRCLGEYEKAAAVLNRGLEQYSGDRPLSAFLAMAEYNQGHCREAVKRLLTLLAGADGMGGYGKAIAFYADHLDETWE